MAKNKRGIDAVMYRNTGTHGSPVWAEITIVSDCQINGSWNKASGTTRASSIETGRKTTLTLSVSGKVRGDDDDAGFLYLYNGFLSSDPVDLLILNGPNNQNGVYGWRADWDVDQANEDQSLQAIIFEDFTLTPNDQTNAPQKVVVAGGVPVYTNF